MASTESTEIDEECLAESLELSWLRRALEDGTAVRIRRRARVTQDAGAQAARVHPSTVSLWESLDRTPRGPEGLRYARVLRRLEEQTR
jgi:DNA-binding transcriptional regulator YiaG